MPSDATVRFGAIDQGLEKQTKRIADKAAKLNEHYKASEKSVRQYEAAAMRAVNRVLTRTERLKQLQLGLNQALNSGRITQQQYNRTLADANKSQDRSLGQIKSLAQSYISYQAAISVANQALQLQRDLEQRAGQQQLTTAEAQAKVLRATVDFTTEQQRQLFAGVRQLAARSPFVNEAQAFTSAAEAISATAGDPGRRIENVLQALEQTALIFPRQQEELGSFTGSLLDLNRVFKRVNLDAQTSLGTLLQAGSQARVVGTENLKNLVPAIQAIAVSAGDRLTQKDIRAGFAFQAALGGAIGDVSGELTRTATVLLQKKLDEFVPRDQAVGFAEQLAFVRGDAALSRRIGQLLAENLEGRGVAKAPIRDIILGLSSQGAGSEFEEVFRQFRITSEFADRLINQLGDFTSELRDQRRLEQRLNESTDRVRRLRGGAGVLRQELFGDDQRPGALGTLSGLEQFAAAKAFELVNFFVGPQAGAQAATATLLGARGISPASQFQNLFVPEARNRVLQALVDIREAAAARPQNVQPQLPEVE